MRGITIVGAGQGGLMLGVGLLQNGYSVKLYSDRSPDDIAAGRILSNQCMWHGALEVERNYGLQFWDENYPKISGFDVSVVKENKERVASYYAALSHPGQSVDQRLKIPSWIKHFEKLGGELIVQKIDIEELDTQSKKSDLVIVATGKGRGEMAGLFNLDKEKTLFEEPQRMGASIYTTGRLAPYDGPSRPESWTIIPGVGEFWIIPAQSLHGPCHIICLQGVVGGPLDVWEGIEGPDKHLAAVMNLLNEWLPWERDLCKDVILTDSKAFLSGGVPCIAHDPICKLPSGRFVIALGDAHILNDPICQQGSNNAVYLADMYLRKIVSHGDKAFDHEWMVDCGKSAWESSEKIVRLTKQFLHPAKHFAPFMASAAENKKLAQFIADANDQVDTYFPWLEDEYAAHSMARDYKVKIDQSLFG